jgi:hypothetical protein
MYLQRNRSKYKNGKEYTSTLLCRKYREAGKIRTEAVSNLSHFPEELITGIENILKSKSEAIVREKDIFVESCYDFGYIFVIEHLMKRLRINDALENTLPAATVPLVKAMIIGKLAMQGSKLAIFNWLKREPELSKRFGLDMKKLRVDDFYAGLAVLNGKKEKLKKKWFGYHKTGGHCVCLK